MYVYSSTSNLGCLKLKTHVNNGISTTFTSTGELIPDFSHVGLRDLPELAPQALPARFDSGATGLCTQPGVFWTRGETWGPNKCWKKTTCRRKNAGYLFVFLFPRNIGKFLGTTL